MGAGGSVGGGDGMGVGAGGVDDAAAGLVGEAMTPVGVGSWLVAAMPTAACAMRTAKSGTRARRVSQAHALREPWIDRRGRVRRMRHLSRAGSTARAYRFSDFALTEMISWTTYAMLEAMQLVAFLAAALAGAWVYRDS